VAGCRCYYKGNFAGTCIIKSYSTDAISDQVWLWYDQILNVVKGSSLPSDEVSFEFFVRPGSSGFVVKHCGVRPFYAPLNTMQSSSEDEAIRDNKKLHPINLPGKRAYDEFEDNKAPTTYTLSRPYACPRDMGLELSLEERISGYHDGHFGKSIPSISCATNVVQLQMQHDHFDNRDEVIVSFDHVSGSPQPLHELLYLAQKLLDYYCYFGELVDNINAFSSLNSLSLYDCNIESLPAGIKHLSSLDHLTLRCCKRLMSLSTLPPSLLSLSIDECTSLMSLSNLPTSPGRLSIIKCTSLETVEFAEENTMVFYVISNEMVYEKVSRIQVTAPVASVTDWYMKMYPGFPTNEIMIMLDVASSSTKSLNSMCLGDTVKFTIT
jgi:hypothetical protein